MYILHSNVATSKKFNPMHWLLTQDGEFAVRRLFNQASRPNWEVSFSPGFNRSLEVYAAVVSISFLEIFELPNNQQILNKRLS